MSTKRVPEAPRVSNDTLLQRLGLVEITQAETKRDIDGLRDDVRSIGTNLDKLIDRQRPQIGVAAGVIVAVLALIAAFASPYLDRVQRLEADISHHHNSVGHPVNTARIEALEVQVKTLAAMIEKAIFDLDTRLQREMRDLDQTMRSENNSLYWRSRAERMEERLQFRGLMPTESGKAPTVGNGVH